MQDSEARRLKIVRFGLSCIPPVAWAVSFSPLFMLSYGMGLDWVNLALIPSLLEAAVVGVVCYIVWYAYKRYVVVPKI